MKVFDIYTKHFKLQDYQVEDPQTLWTSQLWQSTIIQSTDVKAATIMREHDDQQSLFHAEIFEHEQQQHSKILSQ